MTARELDIVLNQARAEAYYDCAYRLEHKNDETSLQCMIEKFKELAREKANA
jgi:hypothetical protein